MNFIDLCYLIAVRRINSINDISRAIHLPTRSVSSLCARKSVNVKKNIFLLSLSLLLSIFQGHYFEAAVNESWRYWYLFWCYVHLTCEWSEKIIDGRDELEWNEIASFCRQVFWNVHCHAESAGKASFVWWINKVLEFPNTCCSTLLFRVGFYEGYFNLRPKKNLLNSNFRLKSSLRQNPSTIVKSISSTPFKMHKNFKVY